MDFMFYQPKTVADSRNREVYSVHYELFPASRDFYCHDLGNHLLEWRSGNAFFQNKVRLDDFTSEFYALMIYPYNGRYLGSAVIIHTPWNEFRIYIDICDLDAAHEIILAAGRYAACLHPKITKVQSPKLFNKKSVSSLFLMDDFRRYFLVCKLVAQAKTALGV